MIILLQMNRVIINLFLENPSCEGVKMEILWKHMLVLF